MPSPVLCVLQERQLMAAERRRASTLETLHRAGICFCLTVTALFPITLVLFWNLGFHWTIVGVVVALFCLLAYVVLAL